jgi:uncharacterized protein (DUF952 family)
MGSLLYKIMRTTDWPPRDQDQAWAGSADDQRDGFLHFSTADQLQTTLEKHFKGEAGVTILAFNPASFSAQDMRWEPSRGGALFPHLYGTLDLRLACDKWQIDVPLPGCVALPFLPDDLLKGAAS